MRKILFVLLLITSLTTSGCALLLIGAAAGLTVSVVKKITSNPRSLTEEERKKTEYREIKGSKEEVLYAARKALVSMGYAIEELDFKEEDQEKASDSNINFAKTDRKKEKSAKDVVTGVIKDPLLRITAVVEKVEADYVGLRLIAENESGLVENKRLYEVLFDEIINQINEPKK